METERSAGPRPLPALLLTLALFLTGCTAPAPRFQASLPPGSVDLELTETPFFPQEEFQCGPAALATVLTATGVPVTPNDLVPRVYLPGRQGSLQLEILAAARRYGRIPYELPPEPTAVLKELEQERPVLILQNLGLPTWPRWHYAVLIGYLGKSHQVVLRSGRERRLLMDADRFLATWNRAERWALVLLRPGELPAVPEADRYLRALADLEEVGRLREANAGYRSAVAQWPQNPTAWLGLGNTDYGLGNRDAAEQAYHRLLRIAPTHAVGHNNLAQVLAERGCVRTALGAINAALNLPHLSPKVASLLRQTRRELHGKAQDRPDPDTCRQKPGTSHR